MMRGRRSLFALALTIFAAYCSIGQTVWTTKASSSGGATAEPLPSATPQPAKVGAGVKRWFDLDNALLQTRYQNIRTNASPSANSSKLQWQVFIKGHFQFDSKAKYRVNWLVQTGNNFTAGWNNTGWGTGLPQTNLYVKQLYFDAKPSKRFEFQIGGIEVNRGEATEAVTYDNDAYLTGERISVRAPKQLFFDEISATNAFLGDLNHPSIFQRLHHLSESNYHQFLVRKQAIKQIGFSVDYTFESGKDRLHEAIRFKAPKQLFFNTLLFETYQRLDPQRDAGFNLFGERVANKWLTLNGGFSIIDRRMTLNGDKFQPGHRVYIGSVIQLNHAFSVNSFFSHAIGPLPTAST
ncbi:MAG: hypothetical protein ACJ73D_11535, partial [Pyrinomonadaceae bacterium]